MRTASSRACWRMNWPSVATRVTPSADMAMRLTIANVVVRVMRRRLRTVPPPSRPFPVIWRDVQVLYRRACLSSGDHQWLAAHKVETSGSVRARPTQTATSSCRALAWLREVGISAATFWSHPARQNPV